MVSCWPSQVLGWEERGGSPSALPLCLAATHPLLQDNAARANSMSGSSVLNNFLALVVSVHKTPLREALIRLKVRGTAADGWLASYGSAAA